MLKGVNKQIIEIKCPESEHFEKILLFIKCENGCVPVKQLGAEIYEYYASLMGEDGSARFGAASRKNRGLWAGQKLHFAVAAAIILSGLVGLLSLLLIL